MGPAPPPPRPAHRRFGAATWLLRVLLLVAAPLAALLMLEGVLRVLGFGKATTLFIADEQPGYYRTNPNFTAPYFPAQFDITPLNFRIAPRKEAGHLRIFVLGESAVRGTPEPAFGFAAQLAAQLRAAYPGRSIEVYNLGIVAVNSHLVYQMAREAAGFEPDLFVVYLGNNEVVGPYGPGSANLSVMPPLAVIRASIWVGGTRTGQLIARLAGKIARAGRPALEWHGMSTFTDKTVRGNDPRLQAVYRNYEANLRDIVSVASKAGIKTVIATVVANLQDSPPFASLHRPGMSEVELGRWSAFYTEAKRHWELEENDQAVASVNEALNLDPQFAEAHFLLGRLRMRAGDVAGGRLEFLAALHWDALRFRPDAPINAVARKVAAEAGAAVRLVDSALDLGSDPASSAPPAGRELLLEHVHFNWEGNFRMGRLLAASAGEALFGPGAAPGAWLDAAGCAQTVGYTEFGHFEMLNRMTAIRDKPPFTNQLTFGDDQVLHQHELNLAAQANTEDNLEKARTLLESAWARAPGDPDISLQLAALAGQARHPDQVLAWTDRALKLVPLSPEILLERGRACLALERYQQAQDAVLEALRKDPYNLPAYTALVEVLRKTGDFPLGEKILLQALKRTPGSGYLRLTYADLLFFHGDHDLAVTECRRVLAREPGSQEALGRLVSLYEAEHREVAVFQLRTTARSTQPMNYENNLALARIYQKRGDEEDVAACLQAAAAGGPVTAQAHLHVARDLAKKNDVEGARLEIARARRTALLMGDPELAEAIRSANHLDK